ncbi:MULTISPECIES: hypothetical protein [unclassified Paenibacillus]|uniref:hypothetical protein n=1 Tax=unclassified Paenibacillus TaxID=185978 RepID=UPI0008381923|nr:MULTISPECIES: hypothetical protein [unclassified Paenibacillus]NWL90397.1 hypothetical protein [Paenibacillus sp. 79R4]
MECIVHFDVHHKDGIKPLRGLIFLQEDRKIPTERDLLQMFEDMGYKLKMDDRDKMIFVSTESGSDYDWIRVRELDTGEKTYKEDGELRSVLSNLMPQDFRPI